MIIIIVKEDHHQDLMLSFSSGNRAKKELKIMADFDFNACTNIEPTCRWIERVGFLNDLFKENII